MKTCSKCGFVGEDNLFIKKGNICKSCAALRAKKWRKEHPLEDKEIIKTCNKCNFTRESSLFEKDRNVCKECRALQCKQRIENDFLKIKTCIKCFFVGENDLFVSGGNICKQCNAKIKGVYYENNIEKLTEWGKIYYQDNKEEKIQYQKEYYKNNKTYILEYKKNYYSNNRESILKKGKIYYLNNREKYVIYHRQYRVLNKKQIAEKARVSRIKNYDNIRNNPEIRMMRACSAVVYYMLKSQNSSKGGKSSRSFFPFTSKQLKQYIEILFEPWMTWNNYGIFDPSIWDDNNSTTWTWQLDHIKPHSDYPYSEMGSENFNIVWDLSNLRPYSSKQNLIDGATKIRHKKYKGEI